MHFKKSIVLVVLTLVLSSMLIEPAQASQNSLTDAQKAYVMKYYQLALEESVGHNVPWQIAMAQGILESGAGTTPNAINNHNHHGITDGKGGFKYFNNDREGWEGYFDNLEKTKAYAKHGIHEAVDPMDYLRALQSAGYAEDPLYEEKIQKIYEAIEDYRIEVGLFTTEEYAEYLELEALSAWPAKERQLVQNELLRLYSSETKRLLEEGKAPLGKAGITSAQGIMLEKAYELFFSNFNQGLATITSREIYDVG